MPHFLIIGLLPLTSLAQMLMPGPSSQMQMQNLPFAKDTTKLECTKLVSQEFLKRVYPGVEMKVVEEKNAKPGSKNCTVEKNGLPVGLITFECDSKMNEEARKLAKDKSIEKTRAGRLAYWGAGNVPVAFDEDTACRVSGTFHTRTQLENLAIIRRLLDSLDPYKLR